MNEEMKRINAQDIKIVFTHFVRKDYSNTLRNEMPLSEICCGCNSWDNVETINRRKGI